MNYKAYEKDNLIITGKARNKKEMRVIILNHRAMRTITKVEYGKKNYTMSDIYAGR